MVPIGEWVRKTIVPGALPGMIGASVWVGLQWSSRPDSWRGLAGCFSIGAVCYVAALLVFSLQEEDRDDLHNLLSKVRYLLGGSKLA